MPKLLVIMLATNTSHQLEPYQIFSCPVNQNTTTSSVSLWLMLSDAVTHFASLITLKHVQVQLSPLWSYTDPADQTPLKLYRMKGTCPPPVSSRRT